MEFQLTGAVSEDCCICDEQHVLDKGIEASIVGVIAVIFGDER